MYREIGLPVINCSVNLSFNFVVFGISTNSGKMCGLWTPYYGNGAYKSGFKVKCLYLLASSEMTFMRESLLPF